MFISKIGNSSFVMDASQIVVVVDNINEHLHMPLSLLTTTQ